MIQVVKYSSEFHDTWNEFVRNSRMPMFMFERGFMDYHADRFTDASLLFFRDEELLAVFPATIHGEEIRSHGGLTYGGIISGDKMKQHTMLNCFDMMREHYAALGISRVVYKKIPPIYSTQTADEDLYALFLNHANVKKIEPATVINLDQPLKMPKGRKAQISRAKREGVIVRESDDFERFIALENEVLLNHGTHAVHSAAEIRLLKDRFPNNIKCYCGFMGENMVAGTILFVYPSTIHVQYLFATEVARVNGALDLVISGCISLYKGDKRFWDFGISSEEDGRTLNEGLISQKEGFGGRTMAYQTFSMDL